MKLSILIVNWNTKDLVTKCINSILQNHANFDCEIILVDNNSSDGSAEALSREFGGKINIIQAPSNLGFAKANNLALRHSSGDYVLLLNPDTEIKHGALQRMAGFMDSHPEAGVLGPKLINPDGTLQPSVRRFPDIFSSLLILSYLHHAFRPKKYLMDDFDYNKAAEVDQVMGAALLTRKEIIEKIGFLDDFFWLWYEEVDFCKRVKSAGYNVVFYPEAVIMHHSGESFSKFNIYQRKKTLARSLIYYFEKNGKWWEVWMLKLLMPIVLSIAKVLSIFVPEPVEGLTSTSLRE